MKDRGLTRHSFDPGADATFELAEGEHHHAEADKEYARVPDIEALASRLRACLQEGEELPRNFAKLFNDALFRFDTDAIPEVVALYESVWKSTSESRDSCFRLKLGHDPLWIHSTA